MQLAVDEVVARGDVGLLTIWGLGFGLLTAISVLTTALRSHLLLLLQNTMHSKCLCGHSGHLIRLPLSFSKKRHIGDVTSRFGSLEPVRNFLAEGAITGLIDGVMALATLAMIFLYSPLLALVTLAAVSLYALVRLSLFPVLRVRSEAVI